MKQLLFKKISDIHFPSLVYKARQYSIYSAIFTFFNDIALASNDKDILRISSEYQKFTNYLLTKEKLVYEEALKSLQQTVNLSVALIEKPLEVAVNLDKKIDFLIKQNDSNVPKYALHCALLSLIGILSNPYLDKESLKEHFIIQQKNLNIAIQSNWEDKNSVNYWYALHYYLRNNEKNTLFFINSLLKNITNEEKELIIDQTQSPWLKKKIPIDFHNFILNEYLNWQKKK